MIRLVLVTTVLLLALAAPGSAEQPPGEVLRIPDLLYIPTPHDIVSEMLELARVTREDVVYDLGCGDGRIVVAAARRYGCRAVGVDIDPLRVAAARENVRKNGIESLVTVRQQDLFETDLREATVVFLYLHPQYNRRLIPQLQSLPPGSRVVSHQFDMPGVKPDRILRVASTADRHPHVLYLWTMPLEIGQ